MTITAQQIRIDLRGELDGDLAIDAPTRSLYATDASAFQVMPMAVAVPKSEADLRRLIQYCHANSIPIIPRGAGTGLSGESLGPGVVIDMVSHFRKIVKIQANSVRVQVGATLQQVNDALAPYGQRFAPNPSSGATCTIGGMLATNASGGNCHQHGYTQNHVERMHVYWDNAESAELFDTKIATPGSDAPQTRTLEIRSHTSNLIVKNQDLIQLTRPQTPFNRCGYVLHDVQTAEGIYLCKLLIGTEGTLAITTEATLRTIPLAGAECAFLLGFQSMNEALRAGLLLRSVPNVVSCDLLDQRLLRLSRNTIQQTGLPIHPSIAAVLMIEIEAENEWTVLHQANEAIRKIRSHFSAALITELQCDAEARQRIQRFRIAAVSGLAMQRGGSRPLAFVEDTAVPGEELIRYVSGLTEILRRHELTGSFLIHVLAAQVHLRPLLDLENQSDREKMWSLASKIYDLAIGLGGTISTQHGLGIARTPWVERQNGPLLGIFRDLKRIFDPQGILNPGKIIGPDPSQPAWPLRTTIKPASPLREPLLVWKETDLEHEIRRCNGCGECRTQQPPVRMCPTFHAWGTEASSPRAKANLLRLLQDQPEALTTDESRLIAESCINCKMCRKECPSQVNIPKLALEAKAIHQAEHGLERDQWLMARIEGLMTLAGNFAFLTNQLLGHWTSRWLFEKIFGLSKERTLPSFTHRTFLRRSKQAGRTIQRPRSLSSPRSRHLAYFVDVFANVNDPLIGEATVAVLKHHGYEVFVPPRQKGCGASAWTQGDIDLVRDVAEFNVRIFADLIRAGYHVICSEPVAAVMLKLDYLDLLDTPDAQLLASQTDELTSFLRKLQQRGELRTDFVQELPLTIGHHVPCHIKALGPAVGPDLLAAIPGMTVVTIDRSCSGMAGTFGLHSEHYQDSLTIGAPMLHELRQPQIQMGSTECGTCRMQMQEGSGKRTLHPVQYLALAYGLVPELRKRIQKPLQKMVTD